MRPMLHHAPELLLKAQAVAVVFLDVDGVLTDGGLLYSSRGESLKRFNVLDGYGLKLLQAVHIVPAVVTGRDSKALRARLQALGIAHAHFGVTDKCDAAALTLHQLGLQWEQAAAMGDDWPDLPLMQRCGFSAAPPNAHAEVQAIAAFVTRKSGGDGAVRELCDLLLIAKGQYAKLLAKAPP